MLDVRELAIVCRPSTPRSSLVEMLASRNAARSINPFIALFDNGGVFEHACVTRVAVPKPAIMTASPKYWNPVLSMASRKPAATTQYTPAASRMTNSTTNNPKTPNR